MLKRIRKVINYLVYQDVIKNDKDLAVKLGYTKSSLSQILNGSVPADKFIERLCNSVENINSDWVKTGEGEMLKSVTIKNGEKDNFLIDEELVILRTENKMQKQIIEKLERQIEILSAQNERLLNAIIKT